VQYETQRAGVRDIAQHAAECAAQCAALCITHRECNARGIIRRDVETCGAIRGATWGAAVNATCGDGGKITIYFHVLRCYLLICNAYNFYKYFQYCGIHLGIVFVVLY
jgi:hypothetical protein